VKRLVKRIAGIVLASIVAWAWALGMGAPKDIFLTHWFWVIAVVAVIAFVIVTVVEWQVNREMARWDK